MTQIHQDSSMVEAESLVVVELSSGVVKFAFDQVPKVHCYSSINHSGPVRISSTMFQEFGGRTF